MTYHLYTDGGLNPQADIPAGSGKGGQGMIAHNDNNEVVFEATIHTPEQTTNQRMEMLAVINGLNHLQNTLHVPRNTNVIVYTDSAYIVNCIKSEWWFNWVVKQNGQWLNSSKRPVENKDLWRDLLARCTFPYYALSRIWGPNNPHMRLATDDDRFAFAHCIITGLNVQFQKVKGHSGNHYNELADKLATRGKHGETFFLDMREQP